MQQAALKVNQQLVIGVGAVGYLKHRDEDILYAAHCSWPTNFVSTMKDSLGKSFGNKTTLLETIGLIVPIYHNFHQLRGKHVVSKVDNVAVVWACRNGRSRTDPYTSVIVTALHYVIMAMPCQLYVQHLPRMSDNAAMYADYLSRKDDNGYTVMRKLSHLSPRGEWPPSIVQWTGMYIFLFNPPPGGGEKT